jgi:RsiW-degrading membrane proteinase PrsW (M82 family)
MMLPIKVAVSLLPVLFFLAALVFLDSYKLVKPPSVLGAIATGGAAGGVCLAVNYWLLQTFSIDTEMFSRYLAPIIEEIMKGLYIVFLIRARRIGFLVDAAIYGFAVGAGFAILENIYYLWALETSRILLWVVRGFGTAALHGATTAIFAMISKNLDERRRGGKVICFLPGLAIAIAIHSAFNHFIIPPVYATLALLIVMPLIMLIVFGRSEAMTRTWLGQGMDADIEMLDLITSDMIAKSPIGEFLQAIRDKFPGPIVADMLCYLRIRCELSMGAKGILLMREAGIKPMDNPDIKAKFAELTFLEKSLGPTGKLALRPFLKTTDRDLWQLYMVK